MLDALGSIIGGLVVLGFIFLPTVVAVLRGHQDSFAIFLTNLLLGWTGIGWLVALIWACTAKRLECDERRDYRQSPI